MAGSRHDSETACRHDVFLSAEVPMRSEVTRRALLIGVTATCAARLETACAESIEGEVSAAIEAGSDGDPPLGMGWFRSVQFSGGRSEVWTSD